MRFISKLRGLLAVVAGCVFAGVCATGAAADVAVGLVASTASVASGGEFEVRIRVTQAGSIFNTYNADVTYDTSRLTFLEAAPLSLQEGAYMTSACGNTHQFFNTSGNLIHVSHSLLCLNLFLSGPGDLYVLRFRATGAGGPATIHFQQSTFYRAGIIVPVAPLADITVQVDAPTDAAPAAVENAQLRVAPNPFNPTTVIEVDSPAAGAQRLTVHDTAGRLVATLEQGHFPAGTRRVLWNGMDSRGQRLPSGSYWITLDAGAVTRTQRVVLLK